MVVIPLRHCSAFAGRRINGSVIYGGQRRLITFSSLADAPVSCAQAALQGCQAATGLPWWAVLMGGALVVRASLFPVVLYSIKNQIPFQAAWTSWNSERAKRAMPKDLSSFPSAVNLEWTLWKEACARHKASLLRANASIAVHIPILVSISLAIRRIADIDPSFACAGPLGFPADLAVADPTFPAVLLPILHVSLAIANVELWMPSQGLFAPLKRAIQCGLLFALYPITQYTPSGLVVYWMSSAGFTYGQQFAFTRPVVQRLLRDFLRRSQAPGAFSTLGRRTPPPSMVKAQLAGASAGQEHTGRTAVTTPELQAAAEREISNVHARIKEAFPSAAGDNVRTPEELERDLVAIAKFLRREHHEGRISLLLRPFLVENNRGKRYIGIAPVDQPSDRQQEPMHGSKGRHLSDEMPLDPKRAFRMLAEQVYVDEQRFLHDKFVPQLQQAQQDGSQLIDVSAINDQLKALRASGRLLLAWKAEQSNEESDGTQGAIGEANSESGGTEGLYIVPDHAKRPFTPRELLAHLLSNDKGITSSNNASRMSDDDVRKHLVKLAMKRINDAPPGMGQRGDGAGEQSMSGIEPKARGENSRRADKL